MNLSQSPLQKGTRAFSEHQRCHWYLGNQDEPESLWDQLAEVKIFHCLAHKGDALGKDFPFKWSYFT